MQTTLGPLKDRGKARKFGSCELTSKVRQKEKTRKARSCDLTSRDAIPDDTINTFHNTITKTTIDKHDARCIRPARRKMTTALVARPASLPTHEISSNQH